MLDTLKLRERLSETPDGELALIITALQEPADWFNPSRVELLRLACAERDLRLTSSAVWIEFQRRQP